MIIITKSYKTNIDKTQKMFNIFVGISGFVLGVIFANNKCKILKNVTDKMSQTKLLTYSDLMSIREKYSDERMLCSSPPEIIVCITKNILESMSKQEKHNFIKLFHFRDLASINEPKFKNYVLDNTCIFISCVPNPGNKTFDIKCMSRTFADLDHSHSTNNIHTMITSFVFSECQNFADLILSFDSDDFYKLEVSSFVLFSFWAGWKFSKDNKLFG